MKTFIAAMIVVTVFLGATCELEASPVICIDLGGGIKQCGGTVIVDL